MRQDGQRVEQVVRDDQAADHVVGDDAAGVADHVGVTGLDAEQVLDIGQKAYQEGGSTAFWNEDRYRINKCLVKQASGRELTEEEKSHLRGMLSAHKLPEQMGAAILLGQHATAVSCIETLVNRAEFRNDRDALRKWYIVRHFLQTLPADDWTGPSRAMFAAAFEPIGSQTPPEPPDPSQPNQPTEPPEPTGPPEIKVIAKQDTAAIPKPRKR